MPPRGRGKGRGRGAASASADGDDNNTESPAPETSSPPPKKESGATVAFANVKRQAGCRDILVDKLDISFHGKNLLENASLQLYCGHRYGLVGANGCGKTTLMNVLGLGEVPLPEQVDYFHLTKEVQASDKSALEVVLEADTEKILLEKELEELALADQDDDAVTRRMDEIYARLDELEADTAESRAAKILFGLGFTAAMQARPTNSFSGGWRMRISLAQALFKNPTFLLLDEPTNHLDIEAVVWLEKHLEKFDKILFLVSHSQDFLNAVCTNIIHMTRGRLINYEGNYDQYVITRSEKDVHQMKRFSWQQNQIKSMKEYIARFGRGHKKLARQAQSKEKTLQKMERGGLESAVARDRDVTFLFPCGGYLPPPILQFTEVSFNYPNRPPLFTNLELGLDLDSRICLVGPNGAGKTTLTKLMCRELEPTSGYVAKNAHCTIARFHQHFVDQINMDLSPLEWMSQEFPEVIQPQPFRQALGRMGVSGPLQMAPMKTLSDGQKSRCVFAWMAFKQPHFLILDEPTNHLDIESIDALADAITEFEGAVVVVSHDLRLIAQVADEIWIVDEGSARRFQGDIADYKEFVQEQIARMERDFVKNRGQQKASSGAR